MADKQDIRENAMSGGTPTRLRGLAANGNSISPTLEEVMNAMGIYTYSFTLAAKEEKDLGTGYGFRHPFVYLQFSYLTKFLYLEFLILNRLLIC